MEKEEEERGRVERDNRKNMEKRRFFKMKRKFMKNGEKRMKRGRKKNRK